MSILDEPGEVRLGGWSAFAAQCLGSMLGQPRRESYFPGLGKVWWLVAPSEGSVRWLWGWGRDPNHIRLLKQFAVQSSGVETTVPQPVKHQQCKQPTSCHWESLALPLRGCQGAGVAGVPELL